MNWIAVLPENFDPQKNIPSIFEGYQEDQMAEFN